MVPVIGKKYSGNGSKEYLSFLKGIWFHFQLLGYGLVNWLGFGNCISNHDVFSTSVENVNLVFATSKFLWLKSQVTPTLAAHLSGYHKLLGVSAFATDQRQSNCLFNLHSKYFYLPSVE